MWVLRTFLDGTYNRSVWQTQEGAIADRERLLRPRKIKVQGMPRIIHPLGWTAITRIGNEH